MHRSFRSGSMLQWKSLQICSTMSITKHATCEQLTDGHSKRQLPNRHNRLQVTTTRRYTTNFKMTERQLEQQIENKVRDLQAMVRENHEAGRYETALEAAIDCVDVVKGHYGISHPVYASSLNNVALLNKALGNLEVAAEQYQTTVNAYVDAVGIDHPNTGVAKHNLALCLKASASVIKSKVERLLVLRQAKAAFDDAIVCHTQGVHRNLDGTSISLVLSQMNLASVLRDLDDVDKAELMLLDALEQISALPDQQKVKGTVLFNLAYHYRVTGQIKKALKTYHEARMVRSEVFPNAHPDVIACLENMAELFVVRGDTEIADRIRDDILVITQQKS